MGRWLWQGFSTLFAVLVAGWIVFFGFALLGTLADKIKRGTGRKG